MKKIVITAGVIVGLGVAGTLGYLKTMSYLSNKTMDIVHQQIDKLNTNPQIHIDYVSESRGRFYPQAELLVTCEGYKLPFHVKIQVIQTLTSSYISAYESSLHYSDETFPLHQWDKALSGAYLDIRVKNWALVFGNPEGIQATLSLSRNASVGSLGATASYADDGRLALSADIGRYAEKGANGQYKAVDSATLLFRYDAQSSKRIADAWNDFFNKGLAGDRAALVEMLTSTQPDIHIELKNIQAQPSLRDPEFSADNLTMDITPNPVIGAPTHITGALTGLGYSIYRRDISWDMALDAPVIETLTKLTWHPEQSSTLLTALAQTSPRLAVNNLRVTGEKTEPMVASGEFYFEGNDISSWSDITFKRVSANMIVAGAFDLFANIIDIRNMAPGQTVEAKLSAGHLYVNGQEAF